MNLEHLYNIYKQDVYSYIMSLTHNQTLSEDLTSETFLAAIKSIHSFKGESTIKTWLFSIARYKWYESIRKQKDIPTQDEMLINYANNEVSPHNIASTNELISKIYELLEQESTIKKDVFLMRIKGYSFYEIASKYSISESSARVIDFRLRVKIKTFLEKEGYGYE